MDLDLFLRLSRPGRKSWSYINTEVSAYRLHDGAITANKGGLDESDVVRASFTRELLQDASLVGHDRHVSSGSAPWFGSNGAFANLPFPS